jgi:hypothetical protein
MSSRIRDFTRFGDPLTDLRATANRSWKLNDFGKCELTLAITSKKARADFLKHRNLLYIQHEFLPPWGGFLFTPQTWDDEAEIINLTAYSGERLLKLRRSEGKNITGTPGTIFANIINLANAREDLFIRPGEIYTGGASRTYTFGKLDSYYEDAKQLSKQTGMDWSIEPALDNNGRLYFLANWYEKRGQDQLIPLKQGFNIQSNSNIYTIQGDLINDLVGRSSSSSSDTVKIQQNSFIDEYGLIEGSQSFSLGDQPGTLQSNTELSVKTLAPGRGTFRISALPKGNLFKILGLGNTHIAYFNQVGFMGSDLGKIAPVRILGMQYPDTIDICDLTVDEVVS